MPESGLSITNDGESFAVLTKVENSCVAPAIIDRSIIVIMLIRKNNGNRYVGRVLFVCGLLNDGGGQ